jgi:hypothetical protein
MTSHAFTLNTETANALDQGRLLTLAELSDVAKAATRACSLNGAPRDLPTLLEEVPEGKPFPLTETQVRQLAELVVAAMPADSQRFLDPLVTVAAAVVSGPADPAATLQRLLAAAWMTCEEELHPARNDEQELLDESDLVRGDFERVTLADRYYLVSRDPHSGDPLMSDRICGLGTAGGLLAECVMAGHVTLDRAAGTLTAQPTGQGALSAVAQTIAEEVRTEAPTNVGIWLDYLGRSAEERVRANLLEAGILTTRTVRRVLREHTRFPPARPALVHRVINTVAFPVTDASRLRVQDAALLALVRATGLSDARRETWWITSGIPAAAALRRAAPSLHLLIEHVAAAVTTAVTSQQR